MLLFVFLLKECLLKPKTFFQHQHDNPNIIQVPWGVLPIVIFILFVAVHWISIHYSLKDLELDLELFFVIHIDHIIFAIFSLLFIWFKLWLPLRLFTPVGKNIWRITAWCNCPYILVYFVLLTFYIIYVPLIADIPKMPDMQNPGIIKTQYATTFFKIGRILADVWCLFILYNAVSIFAPRNRNFVLIGAVIISLLPTLAFFALINR